ncbi:MAG: hypothetical protein ABEJ08_00760 [Halobacteriaceae archaeon]
MTDLTALLVALKTAVLVLGGLITYYVAKASRRTESAALRSLAVGFALVTLGALCGGLADQALGVGTAVAVIVEGAVTSLGFLVITYSLYQR